MPLRVERPEDRLRLLQFWIDKEREVIDLLEVVEIAVYEEREFVRRERAEDELGRFKGIDGDREVEFVVQNLIDETAREIMDEFDLHTRELFVNAANHRRQRILGDTHVTADPDLAGEFIGVEGGAAHSALPEIEELVGFGENRATRFGEFGAGFAPHEEFRAHTFFQLLQRLA